MSEQEITQFTKEWQAHNFAFYHPCITKLGLLIFRNDDRDIKDIIESSHDVDLNTNDELAKAYKIIGGLCELFW
ncbi:MAG: hypothetical protein J5691_05720 [Bacilli bacterium]|nr:hypothetical protein [Bacilli bacterium]